MRKIILDKNHKLGIGQVDCPEIEDGELLVKVHGTGVNRTDLINVQWAKEGKREPILGVEVAGEVIEVKGDSKFKVGDRVMGLVNGGGYGEYTKMPIGQAMNIPENLSYLEAGAIPEVFITAYQTLFWLGDLKEGETVLIHAGASGVGTAAIQMAKKIKNATVIVTAGSEEKLEFCKGLGADLGINYKKEDFDKVILEKTKGNGVDVILDFIGASYWDKNLNSIGKNGRWILIGNLGGAVVEDMNIFSLMEKFVTLKATLLTPRSNDYKEKLSNEMISTVKEYLINEEIKPIVGKVFPLKEAELAHKYMAENKNIGKIILEV